MYKTKEQQLEDVDHLAQALIELYTSGVVPVDIHYTQGIDPSIVLSFTDFKKIANGRPVTKIEDTMTVYSFKWPGEYRVELRAYVYQKSKEIVSEQVRL